MEQIADLSRKLKIDQLDHIGLVNQDPYSPELLEIARPISNQVDVPAYQALFVHIYSLEQMKQEIYRIWQTNKLAENGLLYLVYPKLNNPHYPGIHRDSIFPALGVDDALGILPATQLKFNRMVKLNDIFTIIGLKYLNTQELNKIRQTSSQPAVSSRVADYISYLPQLEKELLQIQPELQKAFKNLTPGTQRQWAREIYSAQTQATREKRLQKLVIELQSNINPPTL